MARNRLCLFRVQRRPKLGEAETPMRNETTEAPLRRRNDLIFPLLPLPATRTSSSLQCLSSLRFDFQPDRFVSSRLVSSRLVTRRDSFRPGENPQGALDLHNWLRAPTFSFLSWDILSLRFEAAIGFARNASRGKQRWIRAKKLVATRSITECHVRVCVYAN